MVDADHSNSPGCTLNPTQQRWSCCINGARTLALSSSPRTALAEASHPQDCTGDRAVLFPVLSPPSKRLPPGSKLDLAPPGPRGRSVSPWPG